MSFISMEGLTVERIINEIANYIEDSRIELFRDGSANDSCHTVKLQQVFTKDDAIDKEAMDFFSQSLKNGGI